MHILGILFFLLLLESVWAQLDIIGAAMQDRRARKAMDQ